MRGKGKKISDKRTFNSIDVGRVDRSSEHLDTNVTSVKLHGRQVDNSVERSDTLASTQSR